MKNRSIPTLWAVAPCVVAGSALAHPGHPALTASDPIHFGAHALPWIALLIFGVAWTLRRPRVQAQRLRRK